MKDGHRGEMRLEKKDISRSRLLAARGAGRVPLVAGIIGPAMNTQQRASWLLLLALFWVAPSVAQGPVVPVDWEARAKAAVSVIRGKFRVTGLRQPVRVARDIWGVAHIYAQNQHDLFFAQGFVAAQDRLFQMELWKRSGQGRLAEVLGESELAHDIRARLLRYRGDMEAEYKSYSPDTKEILEAFTEGINAFLRNRQGPGGQGLPVEFQAAGFAPEPWEPEDCLNRMAAFSMTGNGFSELAHAQAVAAIGAEKSAALFGFEPPVSLDPAPGVSYEGLSPELLKDLVGSDRRMEFPAQAGQ
ncbi:MAG TPA: penicillin acylase family protein, partial [Candidatus Dormibacteraeota bacterium]|nr:penicillin acylase family protein [Candidatus Dormibacteraeota bacterium]